MARIHEPSRDDLVRESTGQNLGKGLSNFINTYYASKALNKVLDDKSLENAPASKRSTRLQDALRPYGETGLQALTQRMQVENQLQQERSIQKLKDVGNNKQATPFDTISSLLELSQYSPQIERSLGPLAETLNKSLQTSQGTTPQAINAIGKAQGPGSFAPGMMAGSPNQNDQVPLTVDEIKDNVKGKLGEKYFPNFSLPNQDPSSTSFKPIKPPIPPKPITPAEKQIIKSELNNAGIADPNQQNAIIDDIIKNQNDSYAAQKEGYASVKDYQNDLKLEDERFFSSVQPNLKASYGELSPSQLNIWKGLSRLSENSGPDETRYRNTSQLFDQLVYEPIRSFNNIGPGLPYGSVIKPEMVKQNLEDSRSLIQDHLSSIKDKFQSKGGIIPDSLGSEIANNLRDSYMASMVEKDWGIAQAAYAVSNLNEKTKKSIPVAPPLPDRYEINQYENPQQKDKYINELSKALMKISPEDSLILFRDKAIQNNYDEADFNTALRQALANGLQLSDYQRQERPKLSVPQRLDLESILRGKRSIFDVFKAKK